MAPRQNVSIAIHLLFASIKLMGCDEYIERLNKVREADDFQGWIELFLDALIEQSRSSIGLIDSLYQVRRKYHGPSSDLKTLHLLDSLFVNPFVRKADVASICGFHITAFFHSRYRDPNSPDDEGEMFRFEKVMFRCAAAPVCSGFQILN